MFRLFCYFTVLLFTLWALPGHSACTTISRTNNGANSVLTSTKYNTDLNTAYTAINSLDGECLQSGTVLLDALGTDIIPAIDSTKKGCKLSQSDAATISISACTIGVNGNLVDKSTATTETWGCTGCASEAASTEFYVYVKDGSTGTTLTPLISTTAPNADGYDGSNNRVIGKFFNDNSSDIDDQMSQWTENKFNGFSIEGIAKVEDVKSNGTDGGTFTSGSWQTRTLNTLTGDVGWITLSSNQMTLLAGTYYVDFSAAAYIVNDHKARLQNITDGSTTILGNNSKIDGSHPNYALVKGFFTIAAAKTFELQHRSSTTRSTDGFGLAISFSVNEVYSNGIIYKLVE
jgi:hypothetical protein